MGELGPGGRKKSRWDAKGNWRWETNLASGAHLTVIGAAGPTVRERI